MDFKFNICIFQLFVSIIRKLNEDTDAVLQSTEHLMAINGAEYMSNLKHSARIHVA